MTEYLVFQVYRDDRWGWTVERVDIDESREMLGFFETQDEAEADAQRGRLADRAANE
jgi:hypothetical protein